MPEGGEGLFDLAVVELARSHAPGAIETLAETMTNPEAPPAARIAAANATVATRYPSFALASTRSRDSGAMWTGPLNG